MVTKEHLVRHIEDAVRELQYLSDHLKGFHNSNAAAVMQKQAEVYVTNLRAFQSDLDEIYETEKQHFRR